MEVKRVTFQSRFSCPDEISIELGFVDRTRGAVSIPVCDSPVVT
jgi:hypothetical protein